MPDVSVGELGVKDMGTKEAGIGALLNQNDDELAASLGFEPAPPAEATTEVDEVGQPVIVKKQEPKPKVVEPPKVETPKVEAKEEPEPEAEAAPEEEKPQEERKLLTQFSVKQGADEVEIPTDLTFSFKGNKKDYTDVPIDKVVLLAQMGVYNQEREDHVKAVEEQHGGLTDQNEKLRELVLHMRQEFIDLLSDENYYVTAQGEYQKSNSPEERARRAEDELRNRGEQQRRDAQQASAVDYMTTQIYPSVKQVLQEFPSVSEDEVLGRFNRLVTPYLSNGIVPYAKLPEVKRVVDSELRMWAQSLHLERDNAQKKTAKVVAGEKTKTQLAKRQVARQVSPTGGKATKETLKPRNYSSAQEWAEKGLDEILEGM